LQEQPEIIVEHAAEPALPQHVMIGVANCRAGLSEYLFLPISGRRLVAAESQNNATANQHRERRDDSTRF
jgi:hypothetical protein